MNDSQAVYEVIVAACLLTVVLGTLAAVAGIVAEHRREQADHAAEVVRRLQAAQFRDAQAIAQAAADAQPPNLDDPYAQAEYRLQVDYVGDDARRFGRWSDGA